MPDESFPRQYARTRRFTLGEPRSFTVRADGSVLFLRSRAGDDPVTHLWLWIDGVEHLLADAAALLAEADGDDGTLPPEELARRERMREQADGITAYSTDTATTSCAFTLGSAAYVVDIATRAVRRLAVAAGAFDARLSPEGARLAYAAGRTLRTHHLADGSDTLVADDDDQHVSWGSADFIAAEELHRFRGHWWSPDGTRLAAARVDDTPVQRWWIADPANPQRAPRAHPYPAAGTPNAVVTLHVLPVAGASAAHGVVDAAIDVAALPYLVDVLWGNHGLAALVSNRSQDHQQLLAVDTDDGSTRPLVEQRSAAWVEIVPGSPCFTPDGTLLAVVDVPLGPDGDDCRALARVEAGRPVPLTPAGVQVRRIVRADDDHALITASLSAPLGGNTYTDTGAAVGPQHQHVLRVRLADGAVEVFGGGTGVHDATGGPRTFVLRSSTLTSERPAHRVISGNADVGGIESRAETPVLVASPRFLPTRPHTGAAAVLLPRPGTAGDAVLAETGRLPVLLDPYGGPHAQRAVASTGAHLTSQWFADQGFAVLVADGRGTPGVGPAFERAVHRDFVRPILDDQVAALAAAAVAHPELDLGRVAMRGWSFGGYLSALAVLERPDVFHAAVAGAPVTEWRLYDTAYTERYLGDPSVDATPYDHGSLLTRAQHLSRPLLLVHGLADDNVVSAHTLRLSAELLAHGRPHEVLPLSGVTHMTPQEQVAENLLLLQVEFLHRALGLAHPRG